MARGVKLRPLSPVTFNPSLFMPWRPISTSDCKFTPAELARLNNIQGGTDGLDKRLKDAVGEFIGAMIAAKYDCVDDGTVPDQLRSYILARTTIAFLTDFPELKAMLTDERKKAGDKAEEILRKIATREFGAIESPLTPPAKTGNWNSEPRLVMRTHPIPPTSQQSSGNYANTDAPDDN